MEGFEVDHVHVVVPGAARLFVAVGLCDGFWYIQNRKMFQIQLCTWKARAREAWTREGREEGPGDGSNHAGKVFYV
jgi:hypothetical protein